MDTDTTDAVETIETVEEKIEIRPLAPPSVVKRFAIVATIGLMGGAFALYRFIKAKTSIKRREDL